MKYLFLFFTCSIMTVCLFAQSFRSINPNQFSFSLDNSVLRNKVNPLYGLESVDETFSLQHSVLFHYKRVLSEQLALSVGFGFGVQGFNYNVKAENGFSGTDNWWYWQKASYNGFYQSQLLASYYLPINKVDKLKFSLGGGFLQLINTGSGITSTSELGENYRIRYEYPAQFTPLAVVNISYVKLLKNMDEIEVGVIYNKSFKDVYSGYYRLHNAMSSGNLYSTGSNVGIELSYVFTGNRNRSIINSKIKDGTDIKLAKKQARQERRYLDPQSSFISPKLGVGICINRTIDEANQIGNSRGIDFLYGLEYEHGIGKNYLLTAGINLFEYYDMIRIVYSDFSSGHNVFKSYEASFGAAYRWITNTNYNIINLYTGVVLGYADIDKDYQSSSTGVHTYNSSGNFNPDYIIEITSNKMRNSNFVCAAYLGVSKDFRICNSIYFSLNYRYQQGFNKILKSDIEYTTNQLENTHYASKSINASAHHIYMSFKLRLR